MRIAYADPPYPGCAHLYKDHPDYAGEVDHAALVYKLVSEYDGYCLHTSSVALPEVLECFEINVDITDRPRIMAWVKPFAAFKANVSVAYAWEPVIVKAARKPEVGAFEGFVYRDWISSPITLQRGLVGEKPGNVSMWLFEVMGCQPDDELHDLFPGTGAVTDAWNVWRNQRTLFEVPA